MVAFPLGTWESENPNTAALLRKWGAKVPTEARPRPAPQDVVPQPVPKVSDKSDWAYVAGAAPRGFVERFYETGKGVAQLGLQVLDPRTGIPPENAARMLTTAVSSLYQSLTRPDLGPAAKAHVSAALKAYEANPGREAGKLIADAVMIFSPRTAMKIFKAPVTVPAAAVRGVTGRGAVEAAAPGLERAGLGVRVAAPAPEVAGESAAARFRRKAAEAGAEAKPSPMAVVGGRLEARLRPPVSLSRPAPEPVALVQPVQPQRVQSSIAPAPAPVKPVQVSASAVGVGPKPVLAVPLPRDLAGAKPRYNLGESSYMPQFESQVDLAAYITAQVKRSARDADYLAYVMKQTGLDEAGARAYGNRVKAKVRELVTGKEPGPVRIPVVRPSPVRAAPAAPAAPPSVSAAPAVPSIPRAPETFPGVIQAAQEAFVEAPVRKPSVAGMPGFEPPTVVPADLKKYIPRDVKVMADAGMISRADEAAEVARRAPKVLMPAPVSPVVPVAPAGLLPAPVKSLRTMAESEKALAFKQALIAREASRKARLAEPVPSKAPAVAVEGGRAGRIPGQGVELRPVESGQFESMGYDSAAREFGAWYKREAKPRFWTDVDPGTAQAVLGAESKGKAFNELIKGKPQFRMADADLALKSLADSVESLVANGVADLDIVRGIGAKASPLGVDPAGFVSQVRLARAIPEDPEAFVAWAKNKRVAEKVAVAEAQAVEVAPVEAAQVRAAADIDEIAKLSDDLPTGMHVETEADAAKIFGGKDYVPPVSGGAGKVPGINPWWDNLVTASDKVYGGAGTMLVRAQTEAEQIMAGVSQRLVNVKWKSISEPEMRALHGAIVTGVLPAGATPLVVEAFGIVRQVKATEFFGTRGALDYLKLTKKMSDQEIARGLAATNGIGLADAATIAQELKAAASSLLPSKALRDVFRKRAVVPSYEMTSDMKQLLPRYLNDAAHQAGYSEVIGSERNFLKLMKQGKHPDYDVWKEAYDRWRGRDWLTRGQITERDRARFLNSSAVAVWLSPITALKQLSQLVPTALHVPARDMVVGMVRVMTPTGKAEARLAAAEMADLRQLMGMTFDTLERVGTMGVAADIATAAAGAVVKVTGIKALDNYVRGVAYIAKKSQLDRLHLAYAKGNLGASRRLVREGVDLNASSVVDDIGKVSKEYADWANLRTDLLRAPMKLTEPGLPQYLRGLTMFSWQITRLIYNDLLKPVFNSQAFRSSEWYEAVFTLGKFAGYSYVLGDLMAQIEAYVLGRDRPKSTAARIATAAGTIGALGLLDQLMVGVVTKEGEVTEEWLKAVGRNVRQIPGRQVGAGISLPFEVGSALLSWDKKRLARMVPIVGPWARELVDDED